MKRGDLQQFLGWLQKQGIELCEYHWQGNDYASSYEPLSYPMTILIERFLQQTKEEQPPSDLYPSQGYNYTILDGNFRIPAGSIEKALDYLALVYEERYDTLQECFNRIGVTLHFGGNGDVLGLSLTKQAMLDEWLGNYLIAIAPCVTPHSWLKCINADGFSWAYVFNGFSMQEV